MTEPRLQAGGTLDPDRNAYVVRPADDEIIRLLLSGEYVGILTSRQMGKSSLVNKAARTLAAQGWLTAIVDLTVLGGSDGPAYYNGLIEELSRKLPLDILATPCNPEAAGSPRDFIAFIERVSTAAGKTQVAIFLDEIDSTLKLPYTDGLFTGIRAIYNERQVSGTCRNIVFCLIGVAMPDELVKDNRTTPYNIGKNIELEDFDETRDDLAVLRAALSSNGDLAGRLLKQILHWTGGQPYLTTKIVDDVRRRDLSEPAEVDAYITKMYANLDTAAAQDVHFRYMLRFIEERWNASAGALDLYERILRKKSERDRASTAHAELKLAGLVKRDWSGMLRVRNRLYGQLFDAEWVRRSRPRRQLVLYRRAAIGGGVATVAGGIAAVSYWQIVVEPDQAQLRARQALAELQVSLGVIDGINWARITSESKKRGTEAAIKRAVVQLETIFPSGSGLGIDIRMHEDGVDYFGTLMPLNKIEGLWFVGVNIESIGALSRFTALRVLSLERNRLAVNFSPLRSLTQLQHLNLYETRCSSLEFVESLPNLVDLSISSTSVTDISLLRPGNLRYFFATFSEISDISVLADAPKLVQVSLSRTRVTSIAPLRQAKDLEALFLVSTPVQDLETIRNHVKLQILSLNGQTVTRIDFLKNLVELRELLLRRIPFEDTSALAGLVKLQKLDLSQTLISSLDDLKHMTALQSLDLDRARNITNVEPLAALVGLRMLSIANTGVSTLEPLVGITKLRYLDLRGCSAIDLGQLRQLRSLVSVGLDSNQLERLPEDLRPLVAKESINGESDFGFNLGYLTRSYGGRGLTWWSGPLDN